MSLRRWTCPSTGPLSHDCRGLFQRGEEGSLIAPQMFCDARQWAFGGSLLPFRPGSDVAFPGHAEELTGGCCQGCDFLRTAEKFVQERKRRLRLFQNLPGDFAWRCSRVDGLERLLLLSLVPTVLLLL